VTFSGGKTFTYDSEIELVSMAMSAKSVGIAGAVFGGGEGRAACASGVFRQSTPWEGHAGKPGGEFR